MSAGGLMLAHHEPPKPGQRVHLECGPADEARTFRLEGEVLWAVAPGPSKAQLIGIRFDDDSEDHTRLGVYLERHHVRRRSAAPIHLAEMRTTCVTEKRSTVAPSEDPSRRYSVRFRDARSFVREYVGGLRDRQLFIRTERSADLGARVAIEMKLPSYPDTVELEARVRRCVGVEAGLEPGLGVELTDTHPQAIAFVQELGRVLSEDVASYS